MAPLQISAGKITSNAVVVETKSVQLVAAGGVDWKNDAIALRAEPRPVGRPRDDRLLAQREHLFGLRESGLRELLRSEGWEDVVAGLRAEVDRLKGDEQPPG